MVNLILIVTFWFLIAVIVYTYAGYPTLLWALGTFSKKRVKRGPIEPRVTVIMSAFNEENWIERKLENLLSLHYPSHKLEILVGSDGASDRTDEIIARFKSDQIRFFRFVKNLGKAHVLNALVEEAHGSILVFTDARQQFEPKAVRALVQNFQDEKVGCVSGELLFMEGERSNVREGMGSYWNYEKFLRKKESEIGSMLGATGAIYAIRKSLFPYVPPDILVDDMFIPLSIVEQGYRAIFDSRAIAYDEPSREGEEEFKRKVRTLGGNYQIFMHFPNLFDPLKSPIAWQLFSHKALRLLIPFALVNLFVVNVFLLDMLFFRIMFMGQLMFYGLSAWEALRETWGARKRFRRGRTVSRGIGYIPYTFCLLNYSAFVGFVRFVTGKLKSNWEKAYAG